MDTFLLNLMQQEFWEGGLTCIFMQLGACLPWDDT